MNAIILHGTLGSPEGNWFRWLEAELKARNYNVWLPQLPSATQPSLKEWADFVHENAPFKIDQNALIVGHSSGAILALVLAQQQSAQNDQAKIGEILAVSVFHDNSLNWEPNNRLFDVEFDWQKIRGNTQKLRFVHSDNDPYVPLDQAKYVADNCHAELIIIPGQGHFNFEQSPDTKHFQNSSTFWQSTTYNYIKSGSTRRTSRALDRSFAATWQSADSNVALYNVTKPSSGAIAAAGAGAY